jgi:predicted SprT family Zn-dependent metalloprotease
MQAMQMTQSTLQQLAQNLWDEYCEIFPKLVKFDCPRIVLNNRFTKTAGMSYADENRIDLGVKFFAKNAHEIMTVTLPHELAHQIEYNLNGWYPRKLHHGKQWQEIMVLIGQDPNPYHTMTI